MGVETASWVTQLVATNPVVGDPVGEGDDHLRMVKTVLQNSFPSSSTTAIVPNVSGESGKILTNDGTDTSWGTAGSSSPADDSITNVMVKSDAAIAKTKLASLDIVNADVNASAAIAQSKLSLDITNSDVNASAAIAQSKLATLAIDTAELADDAVTVAKMNDSAYLANRNLIINGAMQINQRLAVGSTVTTSGIKSTDRWDVTVWDSTHTQGVVANSVADTVTTGASNALKQINTGTSSAASAGAYSKYIIEAQDIRNCGWDYTSASSYVTLSFWVKSSLAGTFYSLIYLDPTDPGGPRKYSHPFIISSADTWTNVSFSIPGNANLEFDNDNGIGLQVYMCAHLGTDYTSSSATDNAWVAYSLPETSKDYLQDWCNTASATWEITAVQLEVGSTATPFEHKTYGQELADCQRYYEIGGHANSQQFSGDVTNANNYFATIYFNTTKRTAPTIANTNVNAASFSASASTAGAQSLNSFRNHRSSTASSVGSFGDTWTADAEL